MRNQGFHSSVDLPANCRVRHLSQESGPHRRPKASRKKASARSCAKKRRYRDHEEVVDALFSINAQRKRDIEERGWSKRKEWREYACTCGGYHITSQPLRGQAGDNR